MLRAALETLKLVWGRLSRPLGRSPVGLIDLPRDVPKARAGYEQLGYNDYSLFSPAAMGRARRVKIASHTSAHSASSLI